MMNERDKVLLREADKIRVDILGSKALETMQEIIRDHAIRITKEYDNNAAAAVVAEAVKEICVCILGPTILNNFQATSETCEVLVDMFLVQIKKEIVHIISKSNFKK